MDKEQITAGLSLAARNAAPGEFAKSLRRAIVAHVTASECQDGRRDGSKTLGWVVAERVTAAALGCEVLA